jgi:hypothetical protein
MWLTAAAAVVPTGWSVMCRLLVLEGIKFAAGSCSRILNLLLLLLLLLLFVVVLCMLPSS